jgi:hypothetical protein
MKEQIIQQFYLKYGPMTDPKEFASYFTDLPADVDHLVRTLQNLLTHIFWAKHYGIAHTEERQAEVQLRMTSQKLARILSLDPRPLTESRSIDKRLVSNCRDYSVLLTAMLRAQGIPARARCGFGTYFTPGKYEDHWVSEYWNSARQRWVMVDAQLDDIQQDALSISFDPLDMPPGKFVLAGDAWQLCRQGKADPQNFGIFQWHGWDFIRGNVFREVLSLKNIEVLPWDNWGVMDTSLAEGTDDAWTMVDRAADITFHVDGCFEELCHFYSQEKGLHVPCEWLSS